MNLVDTHIRKTVPISFPRRKAISFPVLGIDFPKIFNGRKVIFLAISLILRWPIWVALFFLRFFHLFEYLFLVYPGTDTDLDGYCPRWLAKSWLFSAKPTIGGIITKSNAGVRGLTLVIPNTALEFLRSGELCRKIQKRLNFLRWLVGAKAIAIAGQVPSLISRHDITIEKPFVRGNKGTVFCLMSTIKRVIAEHNLTPGKFSIAVVGVGYVGKVLMTALEEEGHLIIGIDITVTRGGVVLKDEGGNVLRKADMVIALTPRGSDFIPYLGLLKPGSIVIDDTHPRIRNRNRRDVHFYKVAVGMIGSDGKPVRIIPRLPGYRPDWIPGCTVEAIFSASTGDFNGSSQSDFNRRAESLGFFAHLIR